MDLAFPAVPGARGIVIGARQSLLSTFLLYQTMAYMGEQVGDWLAALERLPPTPPSQAFALSRVLGGIDFEVSDDGREWRTIGTFDEGRRVTLWAGVSPKAFATLTVTREQADGNQASSGEKVLVGTVDIDYSG